MENEILYPYALTPKAVSACLIMCSSFIYNSKNTTSENQQYIILQKTYRKIAKTRRPF